MKKKTAAILLAIVVPGGFIVLGLAALYKLVYTNKVKGKKEKDEKAD